MTNIPRSLRRVVIQRANDRCEYCGISQVGQVATFHIDHIVPEVAGGETTAENLALACVSCSLRKGAEVVGLSATGRALIQALNLNRATMLAIRVEEGLLGRHPPP